ncbi:hypothetical protein [Methylocystis echinoides]|uniref:hypothetical protein n=1 Tax=Methylocystis echinoides TaxID=29468 RepID=UPI0034329D7B
MRVRPWILLIFALAAGVAAPAAAKEKEERVWTLSGLDKKKSETVSLDYSVPESDYITIVFSCKPKSGAVDVFISETNKKLKPGRKATATLAAGEAKATFPGKLLVNEDAGVPSFEGSLPAKEPLFAALAGGAATLAITVGASTDTETLKGAAEKFAKFNAACAKP